MGGHCAPRHLSQYLRAFTGCSAEFPHAVCTAAPASSRAIRPKLSSLFKCSSVYARPSSFKRVEPFRRLRGARFNERMRTLPSLPADHCEQQLARRGPSARLKLPPLKCMNGLTILHWGHDSSRRTAGGRCLPIPSHVRHLADALTSCIASCQPSRALHAKRPRKPRETVHRRANGAHNDHAPGTAGLSLQRKARPFFRSPPTLGWSLDRAAPRSCNEEVLGYRANMFNNECVIWEHQGWRISTRNRAPAGRCAGPHVVAQKPVRAARERAKLRSRQTT